METRLVILSTLSCGNKAGYPENPCNFSSGEASSRPFPSPPTPSLCSDHPCQCSENPTCCTFPCPQRRMWSFPLNEHLSLKSHRMGLLKLMLKPEVLYGPQQWEKGLQRCPKEIPEIPRPLTHPLDAGHLSGSLHWPVEALCNHLWAAAGSAVTCRALRPPLDLGRTKRHLNLRSHQDSVSFSAFEWVHNRLQLVPKDRADRFPGSFFEWLPLPGPVVNLGVFFTPVLPCLWHGFKLLLLPQEKSFYLLQDTCNSGVTATVGREHP